ncbi:hypothetical protein B0H13DRAFT_2286028 [Mycena leptocephala]|nr:hypothetical protein B0H13DRAFT_2286028 [Mycena leptocephala]
MMIGPEDLKHFLMGDSQSEEEVHSEGGSDLFAEDLASDFEESYTSDFPDSEEEFEERSLSELSVLIRGSESSVRTIQDFRPRVLAVTIRVTRGCTRATSLLHRMDSYTTTDFATDTDLEPESVDEDRADLDAVDLLPSRKRALQEGDELNGDETKEMQRIERVMLKERIIIVSSRWPQRPSNWGPAPPLIGTACFCISSQPASKNMKRDLYFVYFPSPSHEIWIYGGSIVSNKNIDRGKFCEISKAFLAN